MPLRFFPILRAESKIIRENVRTRGISLKSPKNWIRLNQVFEYAIIPLLMRTIRLADDLSASATTRGIDAPCKKQVTMRSPSVRKIALLFSSVYACLARFGFHKENCYDYTQNVQFEYQAGKPLFKNINLTIQEGECLLITGPSGSGKRHSDEY